MILMNIKKILHRRQFVICCAILFLGVMYNFFLNCRYFYNSDITKVWPAYDLVVINTFSPTDNPLKVIFDLMFPVIAAFLVSDVVYGEKVNGILPAIITRISYRKYVLGNLCAILIVTLSMSLFFLLIDLGLNMCTFSDAVYYNFSAPSYRKLAEVEPGIILLRMKNLYPLANIFIFILIRSMIAAGGAVLAYAVSFFNGVKRYIITLSPFVFYFIYNFTTYALYKIFPKSKIIRDIGTTNIFGMNNRGALWTILLFLITEFVISGFIIKGFIKRYYNTGVMK